MNPINLIQLMADGDFHSGQALAETFSVSRTAVWKAIQRMSDWGVQIDSVRGRGYRLRPAIELLVIEKINKNLSPNSSSLLEEIIILAVVDSTNQYLKSLAHSADQSVHEAPAINAKATACLCEYQLQGKGRRGRHWYSPFGANILMSLSWRFDSLPAKINTLSLVIGVAIIRALNKLGAKELKLKWPNDLYWQDQKLGGILFELLGEDRGSVFAIAGIGLNLQRNQNQMDKIEQPWSALEEIISENKLSRNQIVAELLNSIISAFQEFEINGAQSYISQWQEFDISFGRTVKLILPKNSISGESRGIDDEGRFLLKTESGIKSFVSGEVSLRLDP